MSLWLALGAMTVTALALVVAPLMRRGRAATRRDYDLRVYRAQLAELAREQERGLLEEPEAAAARLEIERRMLAAATPTPTRQAGAHRAVPGMPWPAVIALLVALPALAGGLYWRLGSPGQPAAPFADRAGERQQQAVADARRQEALPSVEAMIARLQERLATDPDDLEGWLRLGRAYALTRQFEQSAATYRQAIQRYEDVPELHSALGEALVMAEAGTVGPQAQAAFERSLELDANDARARFYSGLAMLQRGERRAALDAWVALIADTPADAAWLPDLRSQAAALAEDLGLDPEQVLPAAPAVTGVTPAPDAPGPTAEDMRAARDLSAEDRETMIRGMVEGLAARVEAQPDDLEGWRRLARSWGVLGEPEKSADAYAQVARLAPEDVGAQVDYAGALLALGSPERPPSPEVVAQLQKVLTLDQDNPEALFHLGRAAAAQGDASGAAQHWQRLLAQLPASSPERAALQRLLQSLESGG
jgi:cytochrome c-type biogenesis protein CcmH